MILFFQFLIFFLQFPVFCKLCLHHHGNPCSFFLASQLLLQFLLNNIEVDKYISDMSFVVKMLLLVIYFHGECSLS